MPISRRRAYAVYYAEADGVFRCVIVLAPSRPDADAEVRIREGVANVYGSRLPQSAGVASQRLLLQNQLLRAARQRHREHRNNEE